MFATMPGRPRRRAPRPRVEGLEDRRLLATLPAGFAESPVATGLTDPTAMELAPDGRLWVLQQAGEVRAFHAGSTAGAVALDIPDSAIDRTGERGLLGIAFDPSYNIADAAPDYAYLYYTSTAGGATHNRVSRFTVDNSDPDRPALSGEAVLIDLDPLSAATNHNGGAIHFGPDGKLYVGVGDNNDGGNAQDLSTRLGKVLRLNPDGTIPADNPASFPGIAGTTAGVDRAIWAVGLRNPYTFAFEPETGRMFINDVGLTASEEIDPGRAGANYGWPATEGDFDPAAFPSFTRPLYAYTHGTGTFQGFAITGGAFYDPSSSAPARFPASFAGDYFFADFVGNWIDVIDPATGAVARFASDASSPVDLRVAADGGLLYLSRGRGAVSRIAPDAASAPATATIALRVAPAPSLLGQAVSLQAFVTSGGSASPTGLVAFADGTTLLGVAPLVGGVASISTATLAPGPHALTASYLGDAASSPATSAPILQAVEIAAQGAAGGPLVVATGSEGTIRLTGAGRRVDVSVASAGATFGRSYPDGGLPPIRLVAGPAAQTATLAGRFAGPVVLSRSSVPGQVGPTVAPPAVALTPARGNRPRVLTVSGAGRDATVNLTGDGRTIRVVVRVADRARPIFSRAMTASQLARIDLGAGVGARSVRVVGRVATSITFRGAGG